MRKKATHAPLVMLLAFPLIAGSVVVAQAQPDVQQAPARQARTSRVESMRLLMRVYNLQDRELQDTLINFLTEQATARQNVRESKRKLMEGMRDNLSSDAQILSLLNDYSATAEQAKEDYGKALLALDTKVGYGKNPRLKATLVMLGIIGDEDWVGNGPASFGIYATAPKAQAVAPPGNPQ